MSDIGGLDWVQFGYDVTNVLNWYSIRKQSKNSEGLPNFIEFESVDNDNDIWYEMYDNNINAYYWIDGVLSVQHQLQRENATLNGIFTTDPDGFNVNVTNLTYISGSGAATYEIGVFVGCWNEAGTMTATMACDDGSTSVWTDGSISSASSTTQNTMYKFKVNIPSDGNTCQVGVAWSQL